jgi:hypothetical protein
VALTPHHWHLRSRLANGAVVCGQNRAGFGGRGVYVFRDALEPEFEHLEKFLQPGGVFLDIGGNTGIYTVKAAQFYRTHGGGTVVTYAPLPSLADIECEVVAESREWGRLRLAERLQNLAAAHGEVSP